MDKLLRRGGDWLKTHPERELISRRYLRFGSFTRDALERLDDAPAGDPDRNETGSDAREDTLERPIRLAHRRLDAVMEAVLACGGGSVVDLGCGEGLLLQRLLAEPSVTSILGLDVSMHALDRAKARLRLDDMSERRRQRVTVAQGALTYLDERLRGFDVATITEVIEHIDPERIDVFTRVLFDESKPNAVIVTTPNREYNVHFENLRTEQLRQADHRFEWSRAEFLAWTEEVCQEYGYVVEVSAIGDEDPSTGAPTQMAVFRRAQP